VLRRIIRAHPRSIAARHTERTVASDTVHSPSERKMRTGALQDVNCSLEWSTHRNYVPLVTPVLNQEGLCCSESPCIIGPSICPVRHNTVQEIVWRAGKIVCDASSRRALEQDHAVCISAGYGCILSRSVDSCLTRDPEPVERRIYRTEPVVVVSTDPCG